MEKNLFLPLDMGVGKYRRIRVLTLFMKLFGWVTGKKLSTDITMYLLLNFQ